jgi:hypothetical protein
MSKVVPVDVGIQNDDVTEVSGQGLAPNVMAILDHAATLQPGMPVQPIPSSGGGSPAGGAPGSKAHSSSKPQGGGQPTGGQH